MKTSKSWVAAAVLLFVNHGALAAAFSTGPFSSFQRRVPIYDYHKRTTYSRTSRNAILKAKSSDDDVDLEELRRIVAENDAEWYKEFVVDILGEEYEIPTTTTKQEIDQEETNEKDSRETTENVDKVEKKKNKTFTQNATRTSESSDTQSIEPDSSSKEQANLAESNLDEKNGLDDASQSENKQAPCKEEQPSVLPTTAKSQAAAKAKAAAAPSPTEQQQTITTVLSSNNGSESDRNDVAENDNEAMMDIKDNVVSPKDDTVEDPSTLEIKVNGDHSIMAEEPPSDTGNANTTSQVQAGKAGVQAADFENDTSFNGESENKLEEEEKGAVQGVPQSNHKSVDKVKQPVKAKDDLKKGRAVSDTPEKKIDGVLPPTRKVVTETNDVETSIQSKELKIASPANVESAKDDDLDETSSSSSSDTTTIPKVNGDGDAILSKAVTEAATTETKTENDATAAATAHNDEIDSLDESSLRNPEQFEVHYRDLYDRKLVKVVPLTTLVDLGYRVSEIPYLQTDALDLIVQESIKKPFGGLPSHWMISRNQYKVISDDVRILPKEQKEQEDDIKEEEETDGAEIQLNNDEEMEQNSGQTRSVAPRGPPAQRSRTSTNNRQVEPAASRRPSTDRERPRQQNRPIPEEVELREGPRRQRRPTREQMDEGARRPADTTKKRIYTGRERIRRKRKPQRNTRRYNNDPPSPNWFWMDMDTFRNLLAAESELRLRILGKGWAPTVRKEAKWREETYSNWLRLFDKGVGEDLFESRREREKRTRQRDVPSSSRQSREPPMDGRRRPMEREEEDMPRRPDDKNGREADRLERQRDNVNGYSREYRRPEYNGRRPGTGTARGPPDQEWRQRRPDSGRQPPPRMERNPVSRRRPQERNR